MTPGQQDPRPAAAVTEISPAKRLELAATNTAHWRDVMRIRIQSLDRAPAFEKARHARLVAEAFMELLTHQGELEQCQMIAIRFLAGELQKHSEASRGA